MQALVEILIFFFFFFPEQVYTKVLSTTKTEVNKYI